MNDNENCGSATIKIVVHHYAMSQFLIAAEEQDIGTCINGFVSFFPRRSRNIWESRTRIRFIAQR